MINNFFDLLTDARNLLYQKKSLYIKILDARVESFPDSFELNGGWKAHVKIPATIKLTTEYSDPYNRIEVEYLIPESDLMDGSIVDTVAKISPKLNEKDKVALRLAYILYDGNKFISSGGCYNTDLLDQGWRTRVTNMRITHSR